MYRLQIEKYERMWYTMTSIFTEMRWAEMDYTKLLLLKGQLSEQKNKLPKDALASFDNSFDIEYAHNSTAIEGNTLTLIQTKAIIEDGLSVGGKELREIYEVANHAKALLM